MNLWTGRRGKCEFLENGKCTISWADICVHYALNLLAIIRSKSEHVTTKRENKEKMEVHTMKNMSEEIRSLQKNGEYRFEGFSREESRKAATALANAAMQEDRKYGIKSNFGIARDAFGYYFAAQING